MKGRAGIREVVGLTVIRASTVSRTAPAAGLKRQSH